MAETQHVDDSFDDSFDVPDGEPAENDIEWVRFGQRIALAVYGTLTVLGVLEATSFDEPTLQVHIVLITVISTSIAIVLAHAWATLISNRLVFKHPLTSANFLEELRFAAAFLIPTVVAVVVFVIAAAFLTVNSCLLTAEGALLILLFIFGFEGARRSGMSWPRCVLIGLLDVAVGILIVAIKEVHTFFTH